VPLKKEGGNEGKDKQTDTQEKKKKQNVTLKKGEI
jgi:hypothetical protein